MDDRSERELQPSARTSARLGLGEADHLAPGVIHLRFAGRLKIQHIKVMFDAGNEAIAAGHRLTLAIDAHDVHGYHTEVRKIAQRWLKDNREHIDTLFVLFRSPLVKMAVSMVNPVVGGFIVSYNDYEEFDAELAKAARKARARAEQAPAVH